MRDSGSIAGSSLGRLRQEDHHEHKPSMGYRARLSPTTLTIKMTIFIALNLRGWAERESSVKCLPCKGGHLSVNNSTHVKKLCIWEGISLGRGYGRDLLGGLGVVEM